MCRVLRNPLSAVVTLILLLGIPLNASADQITLLATVDGITLTGAGTLVNVSIAAGTGDGAVFQSSGNPNENGTFTLGAVAFTAGPNVTEQYPAGANTQSFSYLGSDGDSLTGTLHWNFIQDNTTNPRFFGTMTVASRSGDPTFLAAWAVGAIVPVDFTTSALPLFLGLPQTLDQLVAGERTAGVGISSGEVGTLSPVSLPAALPLFVSGLVGLGLLGWRRKRKAVVAG